MNKQYVEGVQKWKKDLLDECRHVALPFHGMVRDNVSISQRAEVKRLRRDF